MIYVALAEAFALIVMAGTFANVVRSMQRQQARERDLMLDKLMHLAGRTWTPPPSAEPMPDESMADFPEYDADALPNY